jgi:ABC-type dipeptide/oligopeptide/nickel transport system ATPase subunit
MNIKLHTPKSLKAGSGMGSLKQFLLSLFATSVSIALTFGTAAIIEYKSKQNAKREIVMMVMYDMYNSLESIDNTDSLIIKAMDAQLKLAEDTTRHSELWNTFMMSMPSVDFTETTERIFSSNVETINTVGNVFFTENVADFYQLRNNFKTMVCESISNAIASESPIYSLKRTLDFDFCGYAIFCNGLLVNMQHLFAQCQQITGVTNEEIKAYYDERKQIKAGIKDTDTKSSSKMNELMQLQKEIDEARQNGSVQQPKPRQTRPEGTTLP